MSRQNVFEENEIKYHFFFFFFFFLSAELAHSVTTVNAI